MGQHAGGWSLIIIASARWVGPKVEYNRVAVFVELLIATKIQLTMGDLSKLYNYAIAKKKIGHRQRGGHQSRLLNPLHAVHARAG